MNSSFTSKFLLLNWCIFACLSFGNAQSNAASITVLPFALEEDCFNGIDDDDDGFTDSEDIDCFCASSVDTNNLILNPSFSELNDEAACDPTAYNCLSPPLFDYDCVSNWVNVNGVPSPARYITSCYVQSNNISFPPLSIFQPGDEAFMSILSSATESNSNLTSSDFIGGSLSESIIAGETYEFTVQVIPVLFVADMNPPDPELIHSLNFSLYGNTSGNNFPNTTSNARCPSLLLPDDFVELVNFEIASLSSIQPWVTANVQFVAPATIDNIVFGPGCSQTSVPNLDYYTFTTLLDNLELRRVIPVDDPTDIEVTIADASVACSGETTLQTTAVPGASYQWYLNNIAISTATESTFTFDNEVNNAGEYVLQISDPAGNCGVSAPINISFVAPLEINSTITSADCYDSNTGAIELAISDDSGLIYSWTDEQGQAIAATQNIENVVAGNYDLAIETAEGCTINYQYTIDQPAELTLSANTQNVICQDEPGALLAMAEGGTPGYNYSLDGNAFSEQSNFSLPAGNYTLSVLDANLCEQSLSDLIITAEQQLVLEIISSDTLLELGETAQLNLLPNQNIDNATITWTPASILDCSDCAAVTINPTETTNIQVVVTEGGCTTTANILIEVKKNRDVFIPNAFSPNGDGANDVFEIYPGDSVEEVLQFSVFNRWGAVVYEGTEEGWNGEFRNEEMENGIYVWVAELRFRDGVVVRYKGDVVLVR